MPNAGGLETALNYRCDRANLCKQNFISKSTTELSLNSPQTSMICKTHLASSFKKKSSNNSNYWQAVCGQKFDKINFVMWSIHNYFPISCTDM